MRRKLVLAVLLVTVATLAAPAVEQTDEATFAAQATQKAKNKDLKKEEGKKGKDKKGKDKKGKDKKGKDKKGKDKKKEEEDSPTSGGISGRNVAFIALGVGGATFLGGGLLVRRMLRRPAPTEDSLPGEDQEEERP